MTTTKLDRASVQAALADVEQHGTCLNDWRNLLVLAKCARELLAMRPATHEEMRAEMYWALRQWSAPFGNSSNRPLAELEYRAAERRLLPFADDPPAPAAGSEP